MTYNVFGETLSPTLLLMMPKGNHVLLVVCVTDGYNGESRRLQHEQLSTV